MEDAWEQQFQSGENEREELYEMLRWAYSKLHHVHFSKMEDALMLDKIKLYTLQDRSGEGL